MQKNTLWLKLWAFGLTLAVLVATYLIIAVNPVEIAVVYLGLLAIVAGIGLVTNLLGGAVASVAAVFAVVFINQLSGIYPRESLFINVATELVALLLVGPLAGRTASLVDRIYRRAVCWRSRARECSAHDEVLGILKPEFAKIRLDEEIARAKMFSRPLSVIMMEVAPHHTAASANGHSPVVQAVVRVARSLTTPPSVIAQTDQNQLTLILPEYGMQEAVGLSHKMVAHARKAPFFGPKSDQSVGTPVSQWGSLRAGVATLNGQPETGESLLIRAQTGLNGEPAHV